MIFNTAWFLGIFFPIFYLLFWLMPNARARFYFALASSILFQYHFAGPAGIAPILVMGAWTYLAGILMTKFPVGTRSRRIMFAFGLLGPLLGLITYKYNVLLMGSIAPWLPIGAGGWAQSHAMPIALPLAISFFTFEFVHYLTDVYRGTSPPVRDPFKFSFFAFFFPSVVAGPIKRYQPFLQQVENGLPRPVLNRVAMGFSQVIMGFCKKTVVADNATAMVQLLEKRTEGDPGAVLLLMVLLSIRILFDFSGYSDIAIGLGKMMGLELPRNFNFPYIASNISDFWNRWHMSLSSWIRDYIYIPLGGNRLGPMRKLINLLVTMFLCGLWHGAAWHYGVWGMYHGLGLATHSLWEKSLWGRSFARFPGSRWIGMIMNILFVAYGWLLFFYPLKDVWQLTLTLLKFN